MAAMVPRVEDLRAATPLTILCPELPRALVDMTAERAQVISAVGPVGPVVVVVAPHPQDKPPRLTRAEMAEGERFLQSPEQTFAMPQAAAAAWSPPDLPDREGLALEGSLRGPALEPRAISMALPPLQTRVREAAGQVGHRE